MKQYEIKKSSLLPCFLQQFFTPETSNAQLSLGSFSNAFSSGKTSTYNSLLSSLSSFITPSSYTANWQNIKTTWAAKLKNAKDISTYKSLLTDWVNNINTSAFKPSWLTDKAGWMAKITIGNQHWRYFQSYYQTRKTA